MASCNPNSWVIQLFLLPPPVWLRFRLPECAKGLQLLLFLASPPSKAANKSISRTYTHSPNSYPTLHPNSPPLSRLLRCFLFLVARYLAGFHARAAFEPQAETAISGGRWNGGGAASEATWTFLLLGKAPAGVAVAKPEAVRKPARTPRSAVREAGQFQVWPAELLAELRWRWSGWRRGVGLPPRVLFEVGLPSSSDAAERFYLSSRMAGRGPRVFLPYDFSLALVGGRY